MRFMPERTRALLFLNGLGLMTAALLSGWSWFFSLLGRIVLWPIPGHIDFIFPKDDRAWRMAHMEGLTHGLFLMALAFGGSYILQSDFKHKLFFWSAITTAWLFTLPAMVNPFFGTRGLEMGGGPFQGGVANDFIYLLGWPPVLAIHILLFLAITGIIRGLRKFE
jgi:hypothetical protein